MSPSSKDPVLTLVAAPRMPRTPIWYLGGVKRAVEIASSKQIREWQVVPQLGPIPNLRLVHRTRRTNITTFSVVIDENQTVDELKDKIKERNQNGLATVDTYALTLYKVNIDVSVDNNYRRIINEIFRGVYKFIHPNKQELFPSQIMSEVFEGPKLPHHILVELPTGESTIQGFNETLERRQTGSMGHQPGLQTRPPPFRPAAGLWPASTYGHW